jgi:tetratricopeptide (TPR) repeat protein
MNYKLIALLCFAINISFSQNDPTIVFSGKVTDGHNKKLNNVIIDVSVEDSIYKTAISGTNGEYNITGVEYGNIYNLFYKKDGMVAKSLSIDTKNGYDLKSVVIKTYIDLDISLIKRHGDFDYAVIEKKPVAKAHINPKTSKIDWDQIYNDHRKNEIYVFLKNIEKDYYKSAKDKYDHGDYDESIDDLNHAIEIDKLIDLSSNNEHKDIADEYLYRGNSYEKLGRHEEAIADYTSAIEVYPDYFDSHFNRAEVFSLIGKSDESLADLNKAIEIDSYSAKAYFLRAFEKKNLGLIYCDDYKKACEFGSKKACKITKKSCN